MNLKFTILRKAFAFAVLCFFAVVHLTANAQATFRRAISPSSPMWLVHIDTWNYPDPQKIIDLIPKDIRPFVVMNISLSISHDVATSRFKVAEYGYEIAKSWLTICAQNQMWAVVQHSSGGYAQFSDFDLSVYEEFYRDFPNLIGINYAEQFWGYDDASDPLSPAWTDRMAHFANLLKLSNQYGGYLIVSWCGNQWGPSINPIGMLKRNPAFAKACSDYTGNYILCEKYTQQSYQSDMESICLGSYLSGYSGHYGIRYDDTGWTDPTGEHANFTMATAGAVHLEHVMLTGETVIDGPELIWTQCFRGTSDVATTDGYKMRNWETFPQFDNVSVDLFRKIIDGTVRIPSRQEVIDRSKYVVINDVSTGSIDDIYSIPETLTEGLYRMDGDGNLKDNKTFFKKSGRYPTIPVVYGLDDDVANSFQNKIKKSEYSTRWPSVASKVEELNTAFAQEYTGDIYAGRIENGWVTYNPYKTGQVAAGVVPFKYNTCDSFAVSFSQYTAGVVKEYADSVTFYLSNYDNVLDLNLKTDVIRICGSSTEPTFAWKDRGNHKPSDVSKNWENGVLTLTIKHNGSLDLKVNCKGTATNRLTEYTKATVVAPSLPPLYTGPRQYEAECFDYKNISNIVSYGYDGNVRFFTGQGYLRFGGKADAAVRDTVYALRTGKYSLKTRYSVVGGGVNTVDLYVNSVKVATPAFIKTDSVNMWNVDSQMIDLKIGKNVIEFKSTAESTSDLVFDNIIITQATNPDGYHFEYDLASTSSSTPPAQLITTRSGSAGVVSYTDGNGLTTNCLKTYTVGAANGSAVADLDMFPSNSENYSVTWKEYYNTAGGKKGILMRGTGAAGSCAYADGMKQGYLFIVLNNDDKTVTLKPYVANATGLSAKTTHTSSFTVDAGMPCWYRVVAIDDKLTFECSKDSINWEGGATTAFTDNTYTLGSTQIVWGLNSNNFTWVMDDITYGAGNLSISRYSLGSMIYTQGSGPSANQTFTVSGKALIDNISIAAPQSFEISLSPTSDFASTLSVVPVAGVVSSTTIYARLKANLNVATYGDTIKVKSTGNISHTILVSGEVKPLPISAKYDFTDDVASTNSTTPPALNVTVAPTNAATAGVISYNDANNNTSNMLRAYGVGQRNSTGALNLDLFSKKATDYSVTWKQCVGAVDSAYKVGVLLRGDTANVGTETTGYVQGMKQGYLLLVYNTGSKSEFRIYRSTSTGLSMLVNMSIATLIPTAGQPVWYRASVEGSTNVSLTFEYSTDGTTWIKAASATDNSLSVYKSGATQIIWGLAVTTTSFYLDDITFDGLTENSYAQIDAIDLSTNSITGFNYTVGKGPSACKSFKVSGKELYNNVIATAPAGFELALDTTQNFASAITLTQNNGSLAATDVYVRMIAGLASGTTKGEIVVSSIGVTNEIVYVEGVVDAYSEISISPASLIAFTYIVGSGASVSQSFSVSGSALSDNIKIEAPTNYEISLTADDGYVSSIVLNNENGVVNATTIFVRLKSDLAAGDYSGEISVNTSNADKKSITLTGTVTPVSAINDVCCGEATVLYSEYFMITGQKIENIKSYYGLFIERKYMSDGKIISSKVYKDK